MLKIQAFTAPDSHGGKGLYADQGVLSGDIVWRYNPDMTRIYSINEYKKAIARGGFHAAVMKKHCYPGEVMLNGATVRVLYRDNDIGTYMNHSEQPNIGPSMKASKGETMVALRHIKPGDELTCDYRLFVEDLSHWDDVEHCASFLRHDTSGILTKKAA